MKNKRFFAGAGVALILAAAPTAAPAQSVDRFYAGKTITIVVGAGEGGAYSLSGQLAAGISAQAPAGEPGRDRAEHAGRRRHQGDRLSRQRGAHKDGTALGMLLDLAAATQMLQPRMVRYDLSKFSVAGSFVTDNPVVMVRADAGVKTFTEFKAKPIIVGSSGKGSQAYVHPALLQGVLGANLKLVTGYQGLGRHQPRARAQRGAGAIGHLGELEGASRRTGSGGGRSSRSCRSD